MTLTIFLSDQFSFNITCSFADLIELNNVQPNLTMKDLTFEGQRISPSSSPKMMLCPWWPSRKRRLQVRQKPRWEGGNLASCGKT